jgi:hypothetical protein
MAAANFSSAVANRRVKYDGAFRVPTLLDAQPLDHRCEYFSLLYVSDSPGVFTRGLNWPPGNWSTRQQMSRVAGL